jgi:hypothetical protein
LPCAKAPIAPRNRAKKGRMRKIVPFLDGIRCLRIMVAMKKGEPRCTHRGVINAIGDIVPLCLALSEIRLIPATGSAGSMS